MTEIVKCQSLWFHSPSCSNTSIYLTGGLTSPSCLGVGREAPLLFPSTLPCARGRRKTQTLSDIELHCGKTVKDGPVKSSRSEACTECSQKAWPCSWYFLIFSSCQNEDIHTESPHLGNKLNQPFCSTDWLAVSDLSVRTVNCVKSTVFINVLEGEFVFPVGKKNPMEMFFSNRADDCFLIFNPDSRRTAAFVPELAWVATRLCLKSCFNLAMENVKRISSAYSHWLLLLVKYLCFCVLVNEHPQSIKCAQF